MGQTSDAITIDCISMTAGPQACPAGAVQNKHNAKLSEAVYAPMSVPHGVHARSRPHSPDTQVSGSTHGSCLSWNRSSSIFAVY